MHNTLYDAPTEEAHRSESKPPRCPCRFMVSLVSVNATYKVSIPLHCQYHSIFPALNYVVIVSSIKRVALGFPLLFFNAQSSQQLSRRGGNHTQYTSCPHVHPSLDLSHFRSAVLQKLSFAVNER